jgi:hypothetical protein
MKLTLKQFTHRSVALGATGVFFTALSAFGSPIPANLGSGLDILVRDHVQQREAANSRSAKRSRNVDEALAQQAVAARQLAFTNDKNQVKVYIHLAPHEDSLLFSPASIMPEGTTITATDMGYRAGVIEAWVSLDDAITLAKDKRVSSVILAIQPTLDVGATTSQGVVQHRVNQTSFTGAGITVGVMSDTFGRSTSPITPAVDVSTGDLPGPGNPNGNLQPVVIVDDPGAGNNTDEGRGMAQIVHDMAPAARLGFATASVGAVSFADNIRSLAGIPTASHFVPGFAANVIVDDLYYSDSPMFGTSLVGRAVNEVAALGVSYFSSAGNRAAQQGYFSDIRMVSVAAGQAANPTLNFSGVSPALYAGGFHNFRTDGTIDIAQNIVGGGSISFQWDDPFDVTPPSFNPTPFFTASGTATSTTVPAVVMLPGLTAGTQYRVTVTASPGSALDSVVEIVAPSGTSIVNQDTGIDEEIFFFAPESGTYTINVRAFSASSTGAFDLRAYVASGVSRITTDFNLLFFNTTTGAFVGAIAANNIATNQPLELTTMPSGNLQMVIARANVPSAPVLPTKVRYVMNSGRALEYFDYQTPITFGHNHEPGAISAAGCGPFPPYLPEDYSSPGPSYILFDQAGNRLAQPIIRQKPDVAAATNVNTTFFGGDSTRDADSFPNFGGTSAAAPSAAGIAALVLQAHGGPGSVTQPQMRTILQRAGFPHDLDPFFASGSARTPNGGKLTITTRGNANGFSFSDATNVSTTDTNAVAVSYVGPGSVSQLVFDMRGGNTAGGNEVTGMMTPGLVWDPRTGTTAAFPFTVGRTVGALTPGNITPTFGLQAPAPAIAGQFFTLTLDFAAGTFNGGSAFTFGADRDELSGANNPPSSTFGNNADLWGANYSIPAGVIANPPDPSGMGVANGVRFSGTMSDSSSFSGVMANKNGKGYSPLDGFGFINAQDAVAQPLP